MNKIALLVGATHGKLRGVLKDIGNVSLFLRSPYGGAWYEDEINIFLDSSIKKLREFISELKKIDLDYLFVYWSGHGGYDKDGNIIVEINEYERMYGKELYKIKNFRQLSIFDTCRSVNKNDIYESACESFNKYAASHTKEDLELYRRKFSCYVNNSCSTSQVVFSCSKGECSKGFDNEGSLFTTLLLDYSLNWLKNSNNIYDNFLSIKDAVYNIEDECIEEGQHPDVYGPKTYSNKYFPFVIR